MRLVAGSLRLTCTHGRLQPSKLQGLSCSGAGPGTGRFAGRASVNARAQVLGIGFVGSLGHPWRVLARRIKQKKLRSMRQAKTGGCEESLVERGGGSRGFTWRMRSAL